MTVGGDMGAFVHYLAKVEGHQIRKRSDNFNNHYMQAALFYNSMSSVEKKHIADAFHFELGKVKHMHIRELMVEHLTKIDHDLAVQVAGKNGVQSPTEGTMLPNTKGYLR